MNFAAHALLVLAPVWLVACSPDLQLAPAKPLSAPAEQLAAIPGIARGTHRVLMGEAVDWTVDERELRVRVVQPEGNGPFPLVVFAHGFASSNFQYDAVFEHWASHGYIIIAPFHRDGGGFVRGIFNSLRYGEEGLIAERVADMRQVLGNLNRLDELSPGLAARVDDTRLAAAGHSFGAFTAQQMGGAASVNPETGARIEGRDPRIRAVVALSPPGEMFEVINARSWLRVDTPMLVTTGTWDADGRFVTDWRQKKLSFETAKPGNNWLLVVDGADHYLGNLICRTNRNEPPQHDALRMVNASSTAFLDAFVKEDPAARAFFDRRPLEELTAGFATLSYR